MTRYYYDCPLKAVYMNRYHGISFIEPLAYGLNNGQYIIARSPHLNMHKDTRYYIHPDSLLTLSQISDSLCKSLKEVGLWPLEEKDF